MGCKSGNRRMKKSNVTESIRIKKQSATTTTKKTFPFFVVAYNTHSRSTEIEKIKSFTLRSEGLSWIQLWVKKRKYRLDGNHSP